MRHLHVHVAGICYMGFAGGSAFGSDKDNTVGSPASENGGGGSILQHGDGLDILRIDIVH